MSVAPKFEDTKLLKHADVEAAYALRATYVASGLISDEADALEMAETISTLCAPDVDLVVAALLNDLYFEKAYDAYEGETDAIVVMKQLQTEISDKAMMYMDATLRALHPVEVEDSFPAMPKQIKHGAFVMITVSRYLPALHSYLEYICENSPTIEPEEMLEGLDKVGFIDPVMPTLEQYAEAGDFATTEPALHAEIEKVQDAVKMLAATPTSVRKRQNQPKP